MDDGINTFINCADRSFATISLGKKGMALEYHEYATCPYKVIMKPNGKPMTCDELVKSQSCVRGFAI